VTFPEPDLLRQRVLMLLPTTRDAALTHDLLGRSAIDSHICASATELQAELARGVGVMLIGDECLPGGGAQVLAQYLDDQPRWSDLPVLVLARGGVDSVEAGDAIAMLGNVTLLERPLRVAALVSAVRAASRARKRQYEIETHLKELEQARDAKTQAVKRKDEFLAMLAHELRNPLAPISTGAHLLKLLHSDNAQITQTCSIIVRQVDHMTSLVDDLLDVSRVTRGLVSLSTQVLDFRRVVDDAAEQIRPLIAARRHRVVVDVPPAPAYVKGDHKRLVQVCANLLNNATKYTPEGGTIQLRLEAEGNDYVLTVADDGIGMEPVLVERVFDLFTQAERTPDRSQGGLGLGLALVKSLVELHGGEVKAYSAGLGKGSTFTVRLPRYTQDVVLAPAPVVGEEHRDGGVPLRILLVDDNVDAVHTLQLFLRSGGHRVEVAYSATDALELAKSFVPEVCLLDIGLPDFDGNELARRLRMLPQAAGATLIAMTGYGRQQDRETSMAAGFDHYLVKPVNTMQLADILAAAAEANIRR
jgi:signal transduction histidine kinase